MEDRKRFLTLPYAQSNVDKNNTSSTKLNLCPSIMTSPASTILKPSKPVLANKQSSEPSSPTIKTFQDLSTASVIRRPMHRGFSDLGCRIKKRVTLRFLVTPMKTYIFLISL